MLRLELGAGLITRQPRPENMNQDNTSAAIAPAAKPAKPAKAEKLSFSGDYGFSVSAVQKSLEKLRSDMGRFRSLAIKAGLTKDVRDMAGERHAIVTPEMGAKLKAAGLIDAREAEDIRAFSAAIKSLEIITAYDARKTAAANKKKA
jgi:hypothetical protein